MAIVHTKSPVKQAEIAFKPPHLDKIVFLMQLTGIAHTSSPLRGYKQIGLLMYNLFIIIFIRLLHCVVKIITVVQAFSGENLDSYLQGFINFAMIGYQVYMMLYIFYLSRKSLLASLPKPAHWISLPDKYEKESPVVNNIFLFACNFLAFLLFVIGSLYIIFTQEDGIQLCDATSTNATNRANDTNNFCYLGNVLYIIGLPSLFSLMMVPTYVILWIFYCQRLFEGVNKFLEEMEAPLNLNEIIRCKNQYNMICDLVDNINEKYAIFIAYFLFVASFTLFVYGYSTLISILNGTEVASTNFIMLPLALASTTLLFEYSFSFENAVSFRISN